MPQELETVFVERVSVIVFWFGGAAFCSRIAHGDVDGVTDTYWGSDIQSMALSEIHDFLCVSVDCDGSRHCSWRAIFAAAALMRAFTTGVAFDAVLQRSFSTVVLLLDEVVPRTERDEVSVVSRCGNGYGTCASNVSVTELVGEALELVGVEVVVIPQHVVMTWTASALNALVRAEVEVEFSGMRNAGVDSGAGRDVARLAGLFLLVGAEEPRVVALLDSDERDARLVIGFQLDARLANRRQFVLQYSTELALTDTVAVHNNPVGLESRGLVEQNQQLANHGAKLLNDILTVLLHAYSGRVSGRVSVHRADDGRNRRLLVVASWRMSDVSAQENDRLVEHLRADSRNEDAVHAAEFHVDLQAEI